MTMSVYLCVYSARLEHRAKKRAKHQRKLKREARYGFSPSVLDCSHIIVVYSRNKIVNKNPLEIRELPGSAFQAAMQAAREIDDPGLDMRKQMSEPTMEKRFQMMYGDIVHVSLCIGQPVSVEVFRGFHSLRILCGQHSQFHHSSTAG